MKNNIISKWDNIAIDNAMRTFNATDKLYELTGDIDVITTLSVIQYEIQEDIWRILNNNIIH